MEQALLPQTAATSQLLIDRALDFCRRMIFKGYENLTERRRQKLWGHVEQFLRDMFEQGARGYEDDVYACDQLHEWFEHYEYPSARWEHKVIDLGIYPKYFAMLSATCRCGLDLVDDWAGGVWGWTVGDIRRMYDGELPPWFPLEGWKFIGNGPAPKLRDEDGIAI